MLSWALAVQAVLCAANLRGGEPDWAQCGLLGKGLPDSSQRIVAGKDATPCVWRWQVSVGSTRDGQFCGGTLIHPSYVLTAAHCISKIRTSCEVKSLRIAAGTWKRGEDTRLTRDSVLRRVTKVFMHPLYENNVAHDYDFAVLKLDKPMPMNRCIGVACLPTSTDKPGTECSITGWGTLYSSGPTPEVLQQARVKLLSNEKCEENYTSTITGSMICAAGRSTEGITDTCQGDSGGPLVCKEGAAQRYILRGVTSWGDGCAYEGFPGVYGRVVSVLSWIGDAMDGKVRKAYAADTQEEFSGVNFEGRVWSVVSGPCTIDSDDCILSPGYPENYGNNQQCKVAINPDAVVGIHVMNFSTEQNFDNLFVDCQAFSGSTGPVGINATSSLLWSSDYSITESGWRLCP